MEISAKDVKELRERTGAGMMECKKALVEAQVLGEGFAKHGGPWLQWVQKLFEQLQPGAIDRARQGKTVKIRSKEFTVGRV